MRSHPARAVAWLALAGLALVVLLPYLLMLATSLKPHGEVLEFPFRWVGSRFAWENYVRAWRAPEIQGASFTRYFVNSIVVATVGTAGVLATSALAGYAFARMRFWGKEVVFLLLLGTLMVPDEVMLVPNYILLSRLRWLDTYLALIVPFLASVFGIFFMRQFFASIPDELHDAATIDGCSHLTFLRRVVIPLSRPAFLTVGLFAFLGSWNALTWPLIVTNTPGMRTIQVGLLAFQSDVSSVPNLMMAAATFSVAPVLILFFVLQRYFVQGIARAGLKF